MRSLFLVLLASTAFASDCIDWPKFQEELRAAYRVEAAQRLRENNLEKVCSPLDYYRLTQLESNSESEITNASYVQWLRDFTVNNFDQALANVRFSEVSDELFVGFLAREKDQYYRHEIRRAFYSTIRNCRDAERVTKALASDDRNERWQLQRDYWRMERRLCR